jgi:SAM-dependent methyltransferase
MPLAGAGITVTSATISSKRPLQTAEFVAEATKRALPGSCAAHNLIRDGASDVNFEFPSPLSAAAEHLRSLRAPDRGAALRQYRARANIYDAEILFAAPIRRRTIDMLALRPGDCVLDVGCGTGLSIPLIERGIGTTGRIVGIEQSGEMLAQARARIRSAGYGNVTILHAPVEEAVIPVYADAAVFHFTHDVLRTAAAVANVMRALKPGARVVAAGLKWAPRWAWGINLAVLAGALRSITALEGLDRPWSLLEPHLARVEVEQHLGGAVYLMTGVKA